MRRRYRINPMVPTCSKKELVTPLNSERVTRLKTHSEPFSLGGGVSSINPSPALCDLCQKQECVCGRSHIESERRGLKCERVSAKKIN